MIPSSARWRLTMVAAGSIAILGVLLSTDVGVLAQRQARGTQGQAAARPDLNGLWQALNTAHWDLQDHPARPGLPQLGALGATPAGQGVVEGNVIPYQPWALARKKENYEQRWTHDPAAKCYMPGVPRATYMPFPFQIIQGEKTVMIAYEFAKAVRTIHMDAPRDTPIDAWMGTSNGRWERDTLVVDVKGFTDQTWFDRAGNFHSEALHVVERYRLASAGVLLYEATIEDPKVFTRPWTIRMPLYRRQEPGAQLLEFNCVEFSEDLIYGHLRRKPDDK